MRRFLAGVSDVPGITLYGDFGPAERCPIVALNLWDWDSALVSDALFERFGIATRPGAHCAPLMHKALGTEEQGAVRFSFGYYNTEEECFVQQQVRFDLNFGEYDKAIQLIRERSDGSLIVNIHHAGFTNYYYILPPL